MGARSKAIATFFRNFDIAFENSNISFVFANKLYTNIGNPWEPFKEAGGVNVVYNPSLSIELWDTSETDDVSDTEMKSEKDRRKTSLGSSIKTIRAIISKSRFGTEYRRCHFLIDFQSGGPVKLSGLFSLCNDFGLLERSGAYYKMPGIFEKNFYKKDFINKIMENEKENIEKIQKLLEEKEKSMKIDFNKKITSSEESEEIEEIEDYTDMKKQMMRDMEDS
jgi:hypothetical protein